MAFETNIFAGSNVVSRPAPPFAPTSADNGLSVDPVTGRVVLGNDVGAVGDPARLLSNRDIALNTFSVRFRNVQGVEVKTLTIDNAAALQYNAATNNAGAYTERTFYQAFINNAGAGGTQGVLARFGFSAANGLTQLVHNDTLSASNLCFAGTTFSARGAVTGQYYLHGQQFVSVYAGGLGPAAGSENMRFTTTQNINRKTVVVESVAARSSASTVLVRNTADNTVQQISGASGSFVAGGVTVTVLDGVIISII